jgi:hypothetical protein
MDFRKGTFFLLVEGPMGWNEACKRVRRFQRCPFLDCTVLP